MKSFNRQMVKKTGESTSRNKYYSAIKRNKLLISGKNVGNSQG